MGCHFNRAAPTNHLATGRANPHNATVAINRAFTGMFECQLVIEGGA